MIQLLAQWLLNAIALLIVSQIVPGIELFNFRSALGAVVIMSLVNVLIKPVVLLLTLPLTIVTLGLFTFVINAAMLLLVGSITPGFTVSGFGSALLGSIVLSLVSTILQRLVR